MSHLPSLNRTDPLLAFLLVKAMETSHSVILFVHDNTDVSVSIFLEAPLTGGTKAVVYVDKDVSGYLMPE